MRCKDMFVQWGSKNDVEMYGARFASKEASDQVSRDESAREIQNVKASLFSLETV